MVGVPPTVVPPGNANNPGDDLFSRKAALSVSSALESLTSVFGMGTGMASPLESPGFFVLWTWSAAARSGSAWDPAGAGRDLRSRGESSRIDHDPSH